MMKALRAQGLTGRKDLAIIGQGMVDDPFLPLYDDSVIGMYDSLSYSIDAPTAENKKYKDALKTKHPTELPSYEGACAYDGMMLLYQLIRSQDGKTFDGQAAVQSTSAYKYEGARGPIVMGRSRYNRRYGSLAAPCLAVQSSIVPARTDSG